MDSLSLNGIEKIRFIGKGGQAHVYAVTFPQETLVLKTYSQEHFFKTEVDAIRRLAAVSPYSFPRVISEAEFKGQPAILMPHFQVSLQDMRSNHDLKAIQAVQYTQ